MMIESAKYELHFYKRLFMNTVALVSVVVPGAVGQLNTSPRGTASQAEGAGAKPPEFEVATIKPTAPNGQTPIGIFTYPGGTIMAGASTLKMLVMYAFNVEPFQVKGGPGWTDVDRYDVVAKPPATSESSKANPASMKSPPNEEQRHMLQTLLIERFHLQFHLDSTPGSAYILTRGKGNLKLKEPTDKNEYPRAGEPEGAAPRGGGLAGMNISMPQLAVRLSSWLERPVLDQTGLTGSYDFTYKYSNAEPDYDANNISNSILVSIQAVGLKLTAGTSPQKIVVVDHVERPSAN